MRIPKYWARGTAEVGGPRADWDGTITCWGWSDGSLADATRVAGERAAAAAAVVNGDDGPDAYGYPDRPLREEWLEEIDVGGRRVALLTRNSYGAVVLNTERIMFADVDEPVDGGAGRSLRRLFGRRTLRERAERLVVDAPDLRVAIYETAAGSRCLLAGRSFDPASEDARSVLKALGSDPLYVRLCGVQECFRARLTPKPWRCGLAAPPGRWPFPDADREAAVRDWEARYDTASAGLAACRFVDEFVGASARARRTEEETLIRELHDTMSCGDPDARLA